MTNHIFPACDAMASPIRADRDRCARALCSSSEIAFMLRAVVEAVCIFPCYFGMHGRANTVAAAVSTGIAASSLPQISRLYLQNTHVIQTAVLTRGVRFALVVAVFAAFFCRRGNRL